MNRYTDIYELLAAIRKFVREHPGAKVACCDLPPELGYHASIKLDEGLLKELTCLIDIRYLKTLEDPILRETFKTVVGRRELAKSLETPQAESP